MKQYDILIVEDDEALSLALSETLTLEHYQVALAENGAQALTLLRDHAFKLIITDVQMPVMDGLQLLNNLQKYHQQIPVLLMTAYGSIPKAVEAMQAGAADYLIKPFEASVLADKVAAFLVGDEQQPERVVNDQAMKRLYGLCSKVARTDVTVLLQGDSGTGKEVLANYIHQNSNQHGGPFVAINCAAIPENMLEAMLFGYEKGAFTGAVQATAGKFEQAQNGTLLLDEISEMALALQAKLLRVLQEKEVERLGGHKKIKLNVRILATTNRHLKQDVDNGKFREDLYYRLNVFPIKIPPLKDRPGDILALANALLVKHLPRGKTLPKFDTMAIHKMQAYAWPGNVRELENVVQRALILEQNGIVSADDLIFEEAMEINFEAPEIQAQSIPLSDEDGLKSLSLGEGVKSAEEKIILQTLDEEKGSRKNTAEKLGISPRTLRYKIARMKESGIAVPC